MFYQEPIEATLRFGDVIQGFLRITPRIDAPHEAVIPLDMNIELASVDYFVILSPCCSIAESVINITPLRKVKSNFLKNPYFAEDLSRINQRILARNTLAPEDWDQLSLEEKAERESKGPAFALLDYFIYKGNPLFDEYEVRRNRINDYMIDFRYSYYIKCSQVRSPAESPINLKCLQLSVESRRKLREKIAHFYSRVPEEDAAILAS